MLLGGIREPGVLRWGRWSEGHGEWDPYEDPDGVH